MGYVSHVMYEQVLGGLPWCCDNLQGVGAGRCCRHGRGAQQRARASKQEARSSCSACCSVGC